MTIMFLITQCSRSPWLVCVEFRQADSVPAGVRSRINHDKQATVLECSALRVSELRSELSSTKIASHIALVASWHEEKLDLSSVAEKTQLKLNATRKSGCKDYIVGPILLWWHIAIPHRIQACNRYVGNRVYCLFG